MDQFSSEILKIPEEFRCIQSDSGKFQNGPLDTIFIGVPPNELYGRVLLSEVRKPIQHIHFLNGREQLHLIKAFMDSTHVDTVEVISVGCSSYKHEYPLDYSLLIKALGQKRMPKLRELHLGIDYLFHNQHCAYGETGDVTNLLMKNSHISYLDLYGRFDLRLAIEFPNLKKLDVTLDDYITGLNGGPISIETFHNLCLSVYPRLDRLCFDLECDLSEIKYTLPALFLQGQNLPVIRTIEIAGEFKSGEKQRLMESELAARQRIIAHVNEMIES